MSLAKVHWGELSEFLRLMFLRQFVKMPILIRAWQNQNKVPAMIIQSLSHNPVYILITLSFVFNNFIIHCHCTAKNVTEIPESDFSGFLCQWLLSIVKMTWQVNSWTSN